MSISLTTCEKGGKHIWVKAVLHTGKKCKKCDFLEDYLVKKLKGAK